MPYQCKQKGCLLTYNTKNLSGTMQGKTSLAKYITFRTNRYPRGYNTVPCLRLYQSPELRIVLFFKTCGQLESLLYKKNYSYHHGDIIKRSKLWTGRNETTKYQSLRVNWGFWLLVSCQAYNISAVLNGWRVAKRTILAQHWMCGCLWLDESRGAAPGALILRVFPLI